MTDEKPDVLIVEDEEEIRENVRIFMEFKGFRARAAAGGREALAMAAEKAPDLVLTDLVMPGMDGVELLRELQRSGTAAPVVIFTAHGDMDSAVEAMKAGAADFLAKPIDFDYLLRVVRRAIENAGLRDRLRERSEQVNRIVNSVMDAILTLDGDMRITLVNPACEKLLGAGASHILGRDCGSFLHPECREKLRRLTGRLHGGRNEGHSLWIPDGLRVTRGGEAIPCEATLSSFEMNKRRYCALIVRSIQDRVRAEETIQSLTDETQYLREEIEGIRGAGRIIGRAPALMRALDDVRRVAGTDATVLILGETGSGKELIARAVHENSRRKNKPLVKVNCAAIPAQLIESELFGHERGAFTGAARKRDGRFTVARGGAVFLDEIGEMPLELQAKLLRVLQEGEYEPVGSSVTLKADVRVIAATNRDLRESVREGEFREDLYYRLNVFPIHVPPLRERREDIPELANHFARRFAREAGRRIAPLSPECLERLAAYHWPGNIRELQNVIERAVIVSQGGELNLDRAFPQTETPSAGEPPGPPADPSPDRILTMAELQELERQNIVRALERCNWRVSGENGAAKLLGMNPSTLSSRVKALGITRPANPGR